MVKKRGVNKAAAGSINAKDKCCTKQKPSPLDRADLSLTHIYSDIMNFCHSHFYFTHLKTAQKVVRSLIAELSPLLPEIEQKRKKSEENVDESNRPIQRGNQVGSDSGIITRKKRPKEKLDPLSRAHRSMSYSITNLKNIIAAVDPQPANAQYLKQAENIVALNLSFWNSWVGVISRKIEKWEQIECEFNRLITEYAKVDESTANQLRKYWEGRTNGDQRSYWKAQFLLLETMNGIQKNDQNQPASYSILQKLADEFRKFHLA